MAKRFIDTQIFRKPFVRGLEGPYKGLWIYILTDCDHAGIWIPDFEIASIILGSVLDEEEALRQFKDKVRQFDGGKKWLSRSLLSFNMGN